ncbi:MAG: NYN domain-containing protein, partial [Clostridia bacterium]|nr:NYN domain-containing protein [Clostridia bacterium]
AYTNPLIDSFCIVSGDSDYTPLVGRLKSMGKFVLGISRSEAASNIFINACNEFQFLENVGGRTRKPNDKKKASPTDKEPLDESELNKLIESILEEQTDKDELYASELKGILLRLRPDFNEKAYGCATFLKVLDRLSQKFGTLRIRNEDFNVMVSLSSVSVKETTAQLTKDNWREAFREQLTRYKEDGFDRINPSILKADIQAAYPDFSERTLGFKRFSDILKTLEKEGLLRVELDEQKTMLIQVV